MKTVRFSQVVESAGKPSTHLQLVALSEDRALQAALKQHRVMSVSQSTVGSAADHGIIGHDPSARGQVLIFPRSLKKFEGRKVVGIKYELIESPDIPLAAQVKPHTSVKKKSKPKVKPARGAHAESESKSDETEESRLEALFQSGHDAESGGESETLEKTEPAISTRTQGRKSKGKAHAKEKAQGGVTKNPSPPHAHSRSRKAKAAKPPASPATSAKSHGKNQPQLDLPEILAQVRRALTALEHGKQVQAYRILQRILPAGD